MTTQRNKKRRERKERESRVSVSPGVRLRFRFCLLRDVEAPIALASPIKIPGGGGFLSSAAPAKLPERGSSYSSTVAGFDSGGSILGFDACEMLAVVVKTVWSGRIPVWFGESVGGSPGMVEAEVMLRFEAKELG
ncbi:hypothetical protein IGI04_006521 [Brassica rapa subsp. trilocularis]|uniref:Uncharacterized protein n=1 Tax=Brassica rapa subsp. trilocularis TaxID=1813537 RepID=A0ABQ7NH45_BRACM|nr:hypothetical protein IGI04_006521 [Brassica rapa subsp. trilocularis]